MSYHEPTAELEPQDRDLHRALLSLKEEVEAIDWYHQRWVTATDPALKAILAHNRDEEIEHACMTLEWLRRISPTWRSVIATYLYAQGDITAVEDSAEKSGGAENGRGRSATNDEAADEPGLGGLAIGQLGASATGDAARAANET
ncbi:MAG: ferritin [Deltaproteobacteria bacterium]|nr:ferritin [Deltaproteobacteria bacterium]